MENEPEIEAGNDEEINDRLDLNQITGVQQDVIDKTINETLPGDEAETEDTEANIIPDTPMHDTPLVDHTMDEAELPDLNTPSSATPTSSTSMPTPMTKTQLGHPDLLQHQLNMKPQPSKKMKKNTKGEDYKEGRKGEVRNKQHYPMNQRHQTTAHQMMEQIKARPTNLTFHQLRFQMKLAHPNK
eukprot:1222765-Ditylum_brightwellii.AAC.1